MFRVIRTDYHAIPIFIAHRPLFSVGLTSCGLSLWRVTEVDQRCVSTNSLGLKLEKYSHMICEQIDE